MASPAIATPEASALVTRLRERGLSDAEFDDIYPPDVRTVSSSFWTPISVAMRAAELLVHHDGARVLDVGSGAGKFCIVGAAVTGATFTGIEHREHLVQTARAAAQHLGVDRARFVHGKFDSLDMAMFDALYFYNPFEENLRFCHGHIDRTVELTRERFIADTERAEDVLAAARAGTHVVTYHGFGGEMPADYECVVRERQHSGFLELWIKTSPLRAS